VEFLLDDSIKHLYAPDLQYINLYQFDHLEVIHISFINDLAISIVIQS